jgi:hypothetical protein
MLIHELAHIRRRDCLTQIVGLLACVLYWFNPLVWLASRQMRVERERACDDQVLVTGVKASSYARNLMRVARSYGALRPSLAVGLGMARRSRISERLEAVLDPKRRRIAPGRRLTIFAVALTLAMVLPLAVLGPAARAVEPERGGMEVSIVSDDGSSPYTMKLDGEIELTDDGRDIEWMSQDAYLELEQKIDGERRKLLIEPAEDGSPLYMYEVGRREREYDGQAADWLGDMLEEVFRDGELATPEFPDPPELPEPPDVPDMPELPEVPEPAALSESPRQPEPPYASDPAGLPELPELPELPALPSLPALASVNVQDHDSHTRISWECKEDGASLKVEMEGGIEFDEDYSRILRMGEDAYFKLEEKKGRKRVRLEAEPDENGLPEYRYRVGRETMPFDDEAAQWLAGRLGDVMLELGVDADVRVRRAYEKSGSRGVLDMIERVDSDYARAKYYGEFMALDGPSESEIADFLDRMADDLDSDYEMASVLRSYLESHKPTRRTWTPLAECISSMDSDYEKARVLTALFAAGDVAQEEAVLAFRALSDIDSDYEKARVLMTVFDRGDMAQGNAVAALGAVGDIDSDYEAARVLSSVDPDLLSDMTVRRAYFEAFGHIDSDYEKAGVLLKLAPRARRDEKLREACLDAADGIDSSYEYGRVMKALNSRDRTE